MRNRKSFLRARFARTRAFRSLGRHCDEIAFSVEKLLRRSGWVAHHGLQRNGTNYLALCLQTLGVPVINKINPSRDHPSHKHFRWYKEKTVIPPFTPFHFNQVEASDVWQLNRLSKYPDDTSHIVIQKKRIDAITSIANWGIRIKWFKDREDALNNIQIIANDYDHYYEFWNNMAAEFPDKVRIIGYETLLKDGAILTTELQRLGVHVPHPVNNFEFDEVPWSPPRRKNALSIQDCIAKIGTG